MTKLSTPIPLVAIPFKVRERGLDAFSMHTGERHQIRDFPILHKDYSNSSFAIVQGKNDYLYIERHDHVGGGSAFYPLSYFGFPELACPFCSSSEVVNAPDWTATSKDECDKDNTATLSEKQCRTCHKSFWV